MTKEISKIFFIIGPGGVGKTTCGKILADKLNYSFVDLDEEFIRQIGSISEVIKINSYEKYYQLNSELFFKLLEQIESKSVFILSSGFLTYNNFLTQKHLSAINNNGISILLLPNKSMNKSLDIVVKRQLSRGLGYKKVKEEHKFKERYFIYEKYGDIKIYSTEEPNIIVDKIMLELPR